MSSFFPTISGKPQESEKLMANGDTSKLPSCNDSALPTVTTAIPKRINPVSVLGKILPYALSVFLVFAVTLGCFPAITALVASTDAGPGGSDWSNVYFIPVACFLLFNIGDYLGR